MNDTKHKIIAYRDKVEVWLHADHAAYSNGENDGLESDDNEFVARMTLGKKNLIALEFMSVFSKNAQARFNADNMPCTLSGALSSIKYRMPGSLVSAVHLAEPTEFSRYRLADMFEFEPMFNKLEIFSDGDTWIRLCTDYDDSFVEIEITGIMDELIKLKDEIE